MKSPNHINIVSLMLLIMFIFYFSSYCLSQDMTQSYSDILKDAVHKAGLFRGGYHLVGFTGGMGNLLPVHCHIKELEKKEAVPFLLNVIKNGPTWSAGSQIRRVEQAYHIARCYAILCLASTKDSRAYPTLTDILQNGIDYGDSEVNSEELDLFRQEFDIRSYAAYGLGVFGDSNARDILVEALQSESSQVRIQSFLALARLQDMRSIKPMMDIASNDSAIDQFTFNFGMRAIAQINFQDKCFQNLVQFNDFPELGKIPIDQDPWKRLWKHWYKVGRQWTKQQFEKKYDDWKEAKNKSPLASSALSFQKQKLRCQLGIAALPLLIEKINAGETDLIDIVSELTHEEIERNATKQEVTLWWQNNKEKWLIFEY